MATPESPFSPSDGTLDHLPPHANAKVHERIMASLTTMTSEEFLATLVRSGICTPDGKLTEHYAGDAAIEDGGAPSAEE